MLKPKVIEQAEYIFARLKKNKETGSIKLRNVSPRDIIADTIKAVELLEDNGLLKFSHKERTLTKNEENWEKAKAFNTFQEFSQYQERICVNKLNKDFVKSSKDGIIVSIEREDEIEKKFNEKIDEIIHEKSIIYKDIEEFEEEDEEGIKFSKEEIKEFKKADEAFKEEVEETEITGDQLSLDLEKEKKDNLKAEAKAKKVEEKEKREKFEDELTSEK